ncbi:MAG: hypothetical protein R2839_02410 [Thermomicrobiales bacterium]
MVTTSPDLRNTPLRTPQAPGIYQLKNADGTVLYVKTDPGIAQPGSFLFQVEIRGWTAKRGNWSATSVDFEVIRTDSATEALILENELIKKLQPKYNVMLKDSKTYP